MKYCINIIILVAISLNLMAAPVLAADMAPSTSTYTDSTGQGQTLMFYAFTSANDAVWRPYGVALYGYFNQTGQGGGGTLVGVYGQTDVTAGNVARAEGIVGAVVVKGGEVTSGSAIPGIFEATGGHTQFGAVLRSEGCYVTGGVVDKCFGALIDTNRKPGGSIGFNYGVYARYQQGVSDSGNDWEGYFQGAVDGTNPIVMKAGKLGVGTAWPTSPLTVQGLPQYRNNAVALAGGLTPGAFYRTGGDPDLVAVVH